MKRKGIIDREKLRVERQLRDIIIHIETGNMFVLELKDAPTLVNGIRTLLADDQKIEEIARRIWGF